jgi:hypothetical protein
MSDYDASIKLTGSFPVTKREATDIVDTSANDFDNRQALYKTEEYRLSVNRRVEGLEAAAEFLYKLMRDADPLIHSLLPDDLADEYEVANRSDGATVRIGFTGNSPAVLYLAASKYALTKTKQNTIRQGYTPDRVLLWLLRPDSTNLFDSRAASIEFDDQFPHRVEQALQMYCLKDNTPGDIDATTLPEARDVDLDKSDVLDRVAASERTA